MRIGIDARVLSNQRTGIGTYLINILRCIEKLDTDNEFFLYSNREIVLPFVNPRWTKRIGTGIIAKLGTPWLNTSGRSQMIRDKIDVFWGAQQVLPIGLKIRKVVTVCDFVWHYYPQTMSKYNLFIHRLFAKKAIINANAILCISENTANDLKILVPNSNPVYVTPCAANTDFKPYGKDESRKYINNKYQFSEKYILSVGTVEPRKNIVSLIKAFKILKDKHRIDSKLVIAGCRGWKTSDLLSEYRKLNFNSNEIVFLGFVSDDDMPKLYSGAEIFVFPSLYEGFGLPVLEAMSCGCPVITSNVSSLPEVVGNAGISIDTNNEKILAYKMDALLNDSNKRTQLSVRGLERTKLFSWERSAKLTLQVVTQNEK